MIKEWLPSWGAAAKVADLVESCSKQWILIAHEFTLLPIWMLLQSHVSFIHLFLLISLIPPRARSHECLHQPIWGAGIPQWRRAGREVIKSWWEPLHQEKYLNTVPFLTRATYSVPRGRGCLVQLDKPRERRERRDEASCFRAPSSLKVEGSSIPLYATLQHYGSDLMSSHLRGLTMAGSPEKGSLQPYLCSR